MVTHRYYRMTQSLGSVWVVPGKHTDPGRASLSRGPHSQNIHVGDQVFISIISDMALGTADERYAMYFPDLNVTAAIRADMVKFLVEPLLHNAAKIWSQINEL